MAAFLVYYLNADSPLSALTRPTADIPIRAHCGHSRLICLFQKAAIRRAT
jgi:hypothetical protein